MGQLQGDLDEGIRTGAALLYLAFSKVREGNDMRVHIISQLLGNRKGGLNDLLALKEETKAVSSFLATPRKNIKSNKTCVVFYVTSRGTTWPSLAISFSFLTLKTLIDL